MRTQLGTARGCGGQNTGACVNFASYYLLGIPTAILLAFVFKLGGKVRRKSLAMECPLTIICY